MSAKDPGFTLIELLVSVLIISLLLSIGILSFTHAQKLGRDSKRLSDMRALQQALTLYYNAYSYYPGTSASSGLTYVVKSNAGTGGDWIGKGTTDTEPLVPRFARSLPVDPLNSADYYYAYISVPTQRTQYYLAAKLETRSEAARDGGTCGGMWYELFASGAEGFGRNAGLPGC